MDDKKYCLDTNIFIESWNKYYSMELCPQYWQILDDLAKKNIVFSPIEVKKEIEKTDDGLKEWIRDKPYFFIDIDEDTQKNMRIIMKEHPRLVDTIRQRSIADPWVIALALTRNGIVVTKETLAGPSAKRIKIPDVCIAFGVPWMNDFQFANEVGIRFTATLN
jgi:predicted nucleic acid-binding protein